MMKKKDGSPITTVGDDKKGELLERRKFPLSGRPCDSELLDWLGTCFTKDFAVPCDVPPGHRSFVLLRMTVWVGAHQSMTCLFNA